MRPLGQNNIGRKLSIPKIEILTNRVGKLTNYRSFNTEAKLSFAPIAIQNNKAPKSEKIMKMAKKTRYIKMNRASFV